jgi:hypothetical protein
MNWTSNQLTGSAASSQLQAHLYPYTPAHQLYFSTVAQVCALSQTLVACSDCTVFFVVWEFTVGEDGYRGLSGYDAVSGWRHC